MNLLLIALLLTLPSNSNISRKYWVCSVEELATGKCHHTHVEISGSVTLVKYEADGDTHIRIEDHTTNHFVVAECIPALPCKFTPDKGGLVTVQGISRKDPDHGWYEVHPVEKIF